VWRNPTYTIPGILQAELRGHWTGSTMTLHWEPSGGDVVGQCSFSTPLFDMRPDLRASGSYLPNAQPIFRGSAYGSGARCMVQFHGLGTISSANQIRVFSVEEAHVTNPNDVLGIQTPQDITEQFMDGGTDVIMEWEPPGNPVRYWRVNLFIQQVVGLFAAHPVLAATGCCQ
jgi:hypothetical protein